MSSEPLGRKIEEEAYTTKVEYKSKINCMSIGGIKGPFLTIPPVSSLSFLQIADLIE